MCKVKFFIVLGALFTVGCSGDGGSDCDGLDLPECPMECPVDYAVTCGEPCDVEGDECGNDIGDGRVCLDGFWSCSTHAPLDTESGVCNLVCL